MGNYYTNLDGQIQVLMSSFNFHYGNERYAEASMFLFSRNMAQPDEAHVKEMSPFKPLSKSFDIKLKINDMAKQYCDKWLPFIEGRMSAFRKKNIDKYNELS